MSSKKKVAILTAIMMMASCSVYANSGAGIGYNDPNNIEISGGTVGGGIYYQPDKDTLIGFGMSIGDEDIYNASVSFRL